MEKFQGEKSVRLGKSVWVGKNQSEKVSGLKSVLVKKGKRLRSLYSLPPYKSTHSATEASVARLLLQIQEPVVEIFYHKILSSYHRISGFIVFSLILLGTWVLLGNEQARTKCALGENTI